MKRHNNRSLIAATAVIVAGAFPLLGAHAQDAAAEFTPKSLNITGAVGLPLNPTAQLPDNDEVRIQGNYYDLGEVENDGPSLSVSKESDISALAIPEPGVSFDKVIGDFRYYGLFAAGRADERLEISGGVARLQAEGGLLFSFFAPFEGGGGGGEELLTKSLEVPTFGEGQFTTIDYPGLQKTGFALGAKYLLKPALEADDVAVAVGAGFNTALADNVHAYIVASKNLTSGDRAIKGHIGARYDRFKLQARIRTTAFSGGESESISERFSEKSSQFSAFVGVEAPLSDSFSIIGEVQSKNTDFGDELFGEGGTPYSLSVRYAKDKINASVGIQRQGIINDNGLFAQIGYAF